MGYKTTKAAVIAFTEQIAANYARYGIRANVILPGLMETPMAVEGRLGGKPAKKLSLNAMPWCPWPKDGIRLGCC